MHCGFSQPHPAVHPPRVAVEPQAAIAGGVRHSLGRWFPDNFYSLCHAFAVVGANLASIALGHNYRPVAGLAAIDGGAGQLIDLTFEHNHLYAQANGFAWEGAPAAPYLWGAFDALTIQTPLELLQPGFGKHKIWMQETPKGTQ
jgi:hypothetical protein